MPGLFTWLRRWLSPRPGLVRTSYGCVLPDVLHVNLNRDDFEGKWIFLVGDVHGCHDELLMLLEQADALRPDVQVVLTGDLVNKGPKNVQCVELARRIGALAVRGNHDEYALSVLAKSRQTGQPLPAHMAWLGDLGSENENWLLQLPFTIHFPWLNAIVVHAGLVPNVPLSEQSLSNMVHMRDLAWNESRGQYEASSKLGAGDAWASIWHGPLHVYFGHDARRGLQKGRFATGLDTACVYGGALTGVYLDARQRGQPISVQAQETYKAP